MDIKLGYQIYSAREEAEKDLAAVCAKLKEFGYDGVEFAGFYGYTAEQINDILSANGLVAVSSHVPYVSIVEDMAGTIAFHKAIGCKFIAVPYLDEQTRPGAPGFAAAIRNIAKFGAMCKAEGIQLLYHNHDFEFIKLSGQYGLDFLYDAIPAELLATELDTCWVNVAGENPAAYIRKYAGRCPVVHLKDFIGAKKEGEVLYALIKSDGSDDVKVEQKDEPAFDFRPVGYGKQDIPGIIAAGLESGAQWFIVEQDRSSERPPLDAAKMSCDYVRGL
ncbi:MAG: sugar phosphate isomerase/epimerase [Candidatus Spyradocola sp.]|nr:sugar phosphate isomerase/epimerase [Candidatus Spyradocola sp.]